MKRLILPLGVTSAIFALVFGFFFGWSRYRVHQETRGLREARRFLAAGDPANASVSVRQVLQINPKCAEACRIMGDLAWLAHSPAAVDWRQRTVELEPTLENRLKLAATALRLQHPPYSLAAQTLSDIELSARRVPGFQVLCAELALKMNRIDDAAARFQEASRLEPGNELHRLNLAVLRLQSTNRETLAAARLELERLSTNNDLEPLALRWRIAESVRQKDLRGAEGLSRRLLADPRSAPEDRLQHLSILQAARSPGFEDFLREVQAAALTNAVGLYATSEWMGSHGLANDALVWLEGLEPKLRGSQPVPLALANLYLVNTNWTRLEALLEGQRWPDLEFLRLALLARAAWGQDHNRAGEVRWRNALRAADGRIGPLTLLLGVATEWGRNTEDLLWQIARRFPREQWALRELEKHYVQAGNTRGLNRVYAALMESGWGRGDSTNRNNFAASSMLLNLNLAKAHEIARDLYQHQPRDPVVAATYAYSLHMQGRTREGLAVFGNLKPESLQMPPICLYYGVLLSACGQTQQAGRYLALARTAPLLPEENQLLERARQSRSQDREVLGPPRSVPVDNLP